MHLASVLLPIFLFMCVSISVGQEGQEPAHRQARAWLEFNHHIGGVMVLVLAALTWLEVLEKNASKVIRLGWPTCLIVIGFYNIIWSDKFAWPIDPSALVENLSNREILQHKTLAIMVVTLGLIELLRRLQLVTSVTWLYLFYTLALLTGGLLLGHDFAGGPDAHFHELTFTHALMGLLALVTLVLKVLVDHRFILGRLAYLYPLALAGLGIQLLLFTESSSTLH